jgi:hypothetical protein
MLTFLLRPTRMIPLILLAGLLGAGVWLWTGAHSSTAASEDSAISAFRERAGAAGAEARPGVPAPGVYRYAQTGSETAGAGPLSVSRDLPAEALYIVTPIAGGYHEDLRHSEEHVEEVRFKVDGTGSHAVWRRTKVTFVGVGTDEADDVTPPSLEHPAKLKVGTAWDGTYSQGDLDVSFDAKVTGKTSVTLDGRRVKAFVIRTVSDFSGSATGRRTDELWWAPSLALPVRWTIDMTTGGGSDFTIDADLTLTSGTPQT